MARRKPSRFLRWFLALAILGGLTFLGLAAFRAGLPPDVSLRADLPGIGKKTRIDVTVTERKRGLSGLRVELVQGERVELLQERSHVPLQPWKFWGQRTMEEQLSIEVGSETVKGLTEGEATIRVVADRASSWLRYPQPAVEELTLDVILRPPTLQVLSTHTYVAQGGAEAVLYRVGASSVLDGVRAGDHWFPGYPLPGGDEQERFALFGVRFDLDDVSRIRLVAQDSVGNEAQAAFVDRFNRRPFSADTIGISDSFMERVVPAILAQEPSLQDQGNLLDNYLMINGELRKQNLATLAELARSSVPEFLWTREFMQMRNAQVRSKFADRRTYTYNGRDVDQQDHLGFDLASTRQAEIQAANDAIVVLARYFGIYGNAVVLDHGYGLLSLYGHLSSITVEEGQRVERGQVIGRSGDTGLAGGDHLHFEIQLQGLSITPREWWDAHWIHDRLKLKFGDAAPFN
jgi:murein DD-endopeptidase MepM/ murein hydrolase activator NlpD